MTEENYKLIKEILVKYAMSHSAYYGNIMDFLNHLEEALKAARKLPPQEVLVIQNMLYPTLAAMGIFVAPRNTK